MGAVLSEFRVQIGIDTIDEQLCGTVFYLVGDQVVGNPDIVQTIENVAEAFGRLAEGNGRRADPDLSRKPRGQLAEALRTWDRTRGDPTNPFTITPALRSFSGWEVFAVSSGEITRVLFANGTGRFRELLCPTDHIERGFAQTHYSLDVLLS